MLSLRTQDRGAWLALSLALVFEATGAIWLAIPGGGSRFPAPADVVLLAFFPAAFAAALLFARARLRRFGPALWLDAAIGAVGAAAIVTQLLGGAVERATGGGWASARRARLPDGRRAAGGDDRRRRHAARLARQPGLDAARRSA